MSKKDRLSVYCIPNMSSSQKLMYLMTSQRDPSERDKNYSRVGVE